MSKTKRVQRVDYYKENQDSDSDEMVLNVESEGTQKPRFTTRKD